MEEVSTNIFHSYCIIQKTEDNGTCVRYLPEENHYENYENAEIFVTEPTEEKFIWDHESTLLLLDEYQKRLKKFRNPKIKKKALWSDIAAVMNLLGYKTDAYALDRKMRNMRITFNKIKESNKTKIIKKVSWEYYKKFEEIYPDDESINSTHLISSLQCPAESVQESSTQLSSEANDSRSNTPTSINNYATRERRIKLEKFTKEIEEEDIEEEQEIEISVTERKFAWDHKSTLLLLEEYQKRSEKFRDPKIKKKDLWSEIAAVMNAFGYKIDADGLDRKMRNMKCTFNKIKEDNKTKINKKISWEYYKKFEEIYPEDETANPTHLILLQSPAEPIHQQSIAQSSNEINDSGIDTIGDAPTSTSDHEFWGRQIKSDKFRKRQIKIEEEKLEEMKKIRQEMQEANKINREKLNLLRQLVEIRNNNVL